MPRNITVTLDNGQTHTYQNAPDDITPEQVTARAQQEFGANVMALDGGRNLAPAPKKPAAPALNTSAGQAGASRQKDWGNIAPEKAASILQTAQDAITRRLGSAKADVRIAALNKFNSDPRMQRLRQVAGLTPVQTKEEGIRQIARENLRGTDLEKNSGSAGMIASATRAAFGLPERISAGIRYAAGGQGKSYADELAITRAETDQLMQGGNTGGNILGSVFGSVTGGAGSGKLVQAGAGRLAASGAPILAKAGNYLQRLGTVASNGKLAAGSKIALAGATGGTAQALGEGSNPVTGALEGVGGALAGGALIKGVGQVGKLARAVARPYSGSVPKAIQEVVTEAPDAIRTRQLELSARTGSNVPLVAALKPRDFRNVTDKVLKNSDEALEIAKTNTGNHIRGFMDRMLGHVNQAGKTGQAMISTVGDLADLRKNTADDLMAPIASRTVNLTHLPLDDLERQVTKEIGSRDRALGPRLRTALTDLAPGDEASGEDIAAARKLMDSWGLSTPVHVTVREMDNLRRSLNQASKNSAQSNPANSLAYRNAAKTIQDFVGENHPEYKQVVDTYAAQSRMLEGFKTASAGKRITDIEDDQLRANLRSAEGRIGLKAGELARLREQASGKPSQAINLAADLGSESRLTRPASLEPGAAQPGTVTEHLGEQASSDLADAAAAEHTVLGKMIDMDRIKVPKDGEGDLVTPENIVFGAFLGPSLGATKARFIARMLEKLPHGFNDRVATNIADMVFSNDAAKTGQALRALEKVGVGKKVVRGLMSDAINLSTATGAVSASGGSEASIPLASDDLKNEPGPVEAMLNASAQGTEEAAPETAPAELTPDEAQSPYAENLQAIYQNESPELLDLIDRVSGQESGGRQHDDQGNPIQSSAGAIGIMQVMPDTAPEAAQLAGVPFNEEAYHNDAAYNKLIGIAYLSEMLRRYDGDVAKALAAYNAGQGNVDQAIASGDENWLAQLPAETQDYVDKLA